MFQLSADGLFARGSFFWTSVACQRHNGWSCWSPRLKPSYCPVSTDAYIFHHTIDPKYVAYFFQTESFPSQKKPHITGTKVRRISGERLAKIQIHVPRIEEQERIVAILDNFDALVNDLSSGLPAEIPARRQQYEHYRDRLLTFAEAA